MKFTGIITALLACATFSAALPQHGAGPLDDGGLGLTLCNRVRALNMDCYTHIDALITATATGAQIFYDKAGHEWENGGDGNYWYQRAEETQLVSEALKQHRDWTT